MIAKLTGVVDSIGDGWIVVDVGGVGYLVACPARTLTRLSPGAAVSLRIETIVREDAIALFGFVEEAERVWFRLLTSVQGVGAKAALAVLSALPAGDLALAVAAGDRQAIGRAAGIGPKLAQRIVAVLADKAAAAALPAAPSGEGTSVPAAPSGTADAVAALVGLGFAPADALAAVAAAARSLAPDAAAEALIRGGLARLAPPEPAR